MSEAVYTVLFYATALLAVGFAIAVTTSRRLLRAAVYLMGTLLMSAGFYVMLGAEFLAGIQVLVYVGGIVVVIVFAVMLTRSAEIQLDSPPLYRRVFGILASIAFAAMTAWVILTCVFSPMETAPTAKGNTEAIGLKLLDTGSSGYILPFEIISLLLLAAMIGGIVIARKTPPQSQPFTTKGDLPDEVKVDLPHNQRKADSAKERP